VAAFSIRHRRRRMAACATDLDLCRRVQPFDEPRPRGRWYVLRAIGRKLLSGSGCGTAQCVERSALGIIGRSDANDVFKRPALEKGRLLEAATHEPFDHGAERASAGTRVCGLARFSGARGPALGAGGHSVETGAPEPIVARTDGVTPATLGSQLPAFETSASAIIEPESRRITMSFVLPRSPLPARRHWKPSIGSASQLTAQTKCDFGTLSRSFHPQWNAPKRAWFGKPGSPVLRQSPNALSR
jgi:hypothetical protein